MSKSSNAIRKREKLLALRSKPREGGFTLAGVKAMADGIAGGAGKARIVKCRIEKFLVTQVYSIPVYWEGTEVERRTKVIYSNERYRAVVTTSVEQYCDKESAFGQYRFDGQLRLEIDKLTQRSGENPVFLVIEEQGETENQDFSLGECWRNTNPEVPGDIWLFRTTDGNWPGGIEDTETTTRVLAAIKVETQATHSLRRGTRSLCYRTTDNETVYGMEAQLHIAYGAPHVVRRLEGKGIGEWANRVTDLTMMIERASIDASIAEVTEAILLGESQEDEYFRLWYLRLWEALQNLLEEYCQSKGIECVGEEKEPKIESLLEHRNEIVHWETDRIDFNKLTELQRFAIEIFRQTIVSESKDS